jgi:hypothetical protein
MINRLMISVAAAALIAGTGFANAQGTGMSREAPSGAAPAQQSAPSSERGASDRGTSGSEMNRDAAKPEMKSTQSEQKTPAAGTNQRADEKTMPGQKSKSMSSENDNNAKAKDMKAEGRDDRNGMKAQGSEDRSGKMNAESKGGAENKSQTVGQAGAGAKLSTEQRTKITTVIKEQHVQPVTNVNFSISVGTRVPRDVSFHPLPAEIVTVYPDWRGYEFILVRNQIVVVDPQTLEIVAVLDA